MIMKAFRIIFSSILVCLTVSFFAPEIKAQESLKSQIVTEYNGKSYYIHTVKKKQTLKDIADIYGVTTYEIIKENKIVKTTLKAGEVLRIPYKEQVEEPKEEYVFAEEEVVMDTITGSDTTEYVEEFVLPMFNSERLYKVALMMPLYLEQVDDAFLESEASNKLLLAKPFSYLHFYEGFMIAVDSMVSQYDMKLDLKVYDVDQDTNKVVSAINDPWLANADVIVGPFHVKAFEKVMAFAAENDILVVNPMTNRDELVQGNRNVVKVKPSYRYQMQGLESLIKDKYADNNVFIFAEDTNSMDYVRMIDEIANRTVNPYSLVPNKHIKKIVKKRQDAWKIEEVEFNENEYHSDNMTLNMSLINLNPDDSTMLKNQIMFFDYSIDSLKKVKKMASSIRNNVFIVYGEDKVFATEVLNKINIFSGTYPSKLIVLPEWSKFDRLFNENLMKLNTVMFDDDYTDYDTYAVGSFVGKFRDNYGTEPKDIAFHGFNIAWYFLNALMNYGDNINIGITSYDIPLLNTRYSFERNDAEDGLLNTYWNIYMYQDYEKKLLQYE